MQGNVLVVDDDPDILLAARLLLKRHFAQVDIEKNPDRIPFLLGQTEYDAVLLDMNFTADDARSGRAGFAWLDKILDLSPNVAVVLITAHGDVEMAVRAIKAGATDFVLKPWENDKLITTLSGVVQRAESLGKRAEGVERRAALPSAERGPALSPKLIAESPAMQRVLDTVGRVANTDANILILGENGTGKDLIARELHRLSGRAAGPFVAVDVGALPDTLFESELFGSMRGAFTDAKTDRAGRFEEAQNGTLFLDEIGNIGPAQQARLLTALQQRSVTRLGSNRPIAVNARVICATNAPLHELVAQKQFRADLLYRINTIEIELPPLRDRPEDILPLAEHFLALYRKQYSRPVSQLSAALVQKLRQHSWPGNIRELQHALERAVILSQHRHALQPDDVALSTPSASNRSGGAVANTAVPLDEMERAAIRQAMARYGGNISDVARELGLSRQALYRRMEKYGM